MKKSVRKSKAEKPVTGQTALQLGSLLDETDAARAEPKSGAPREKFAGRPGTPAVPVNLPGEASSPDQASEAMRPRRWRRHQIRLRARRPWMIATMAACALATVAFVWAAMMASDVLSLKSSLDKAKAENAAWQKKYHEVVFAAREVSTDNEVRGRVIIRDASHKRNPLPGIVMRLYRRADIEAYLNERQAKISEAGGKDRARLTAHFLKNLPAPIEISDSDSDGRFHFQIPEPGEYVIQTSIHSGVTGEIRLWFVTFDSRDPLNTEVAVTESNSVQQFNPVFMLMEGR